MTKRQAWLRAGLQGGRALPGSRAPGEPRARVPRSPRCLPRRRGTPPPRRR